MPWIACQADHTDEEWDSIPEVGNLTRKKRKRDERSFVVPDSVLVGDRSRGEYENALDARQQEVCMLAVIILLSYLILHDYTGRRLRDPS